MTNKLYAVIVAGGAAAVSLALSDARPSVAASSKIDSVYVANDGTQPVPVAGTVQISGNVPVSFPAVQQVAGQVTLAPGATVKIVTNDGQNTVTAKASGQNTELDDSETSGEGPLTFLTNNGTTVTNVLPGGKRLVVETLSAKLELPASQQPGEVEVIAGNSIVYLPVQRVGSTPSGSATYAATVPSRMYIDTSATFYWTRSAGTGSAFISLTASGYLVDVQ